MLDFIQEGEVPLLYYYLYWLSIIIVLFIAMKSSKRPIQDQVGRWRTILFFSFFVFFAITYMVGSDYFQYRYHVQNPPIWFDSLNGQEKVYKYLYSFCYNRYDLFRLIVWGGAILLVTLTAKRLDLSVYYVLLIWFFFFCDRICYARASLGMAVFFLGFSLLVSAKKDLLLIISGFVLMGVSVLFHRSLYVLIALLPILFLKLTRKNIVFFSILLFIVFFIIARYIGLDTQNLESILDEGGLDRLNTYSELIAAGEGSWTRLNLLGIVYTLVSNFLFYYIMIIEAKYYFSEESRGDSSFRSLFVFSYAIIILATVFLLLYGQNNPFFYRCLYMTHIPLSICFVRMLIQNKLSRRSYVFSMLYAFLLHSAVFVDALIE